MEFSSKREGQRPQGDVDGSYVGSFQWQRIYTDFALQNVHFFRAVHAAEFGIAVSISEYPCCQKAKHYRPKGGQLPAQLQASSHWFETKQEMIPVLLANTQT